jgi:catechol 2,3-dioxygenase-like lactoylglutathione lyase family enzyme
MHVSHVMLRVADIERSVAFYRDAVGLEVIAAAEAFAFLDAGTIRLALNRSDDAGATDSLTEIVLEVDDIEPAYREMSERGVPFAVAPREVTRAGDRSLHAAHFRDPDGHLWSLTGWTEAGEP